ncbi:type II secretion system F family protein [Desulfotalea psychrophila]|uniref:Hypothetical membrane protein n=1 Tax=Desulfotalea psychrophila (strain LSv54 / DSM 12343) TaxID=177439 RepID=Q6AN17_DESPS|nr:type II secretion system F family protein [Desulfotalea psychrophila]CAG36257.1 hypothetical membrane protein [Desulfotalea psychrophila LSv54]
MEQDIVTRAQKWCKRYSNGNGKAKANERGGHTIWTVLGLPGAKMKAGTESIYSGTPLFYQRAGIYDSTSLRSYQLLRYFLLVLPLLLLTISHVVGFRTFTERLLAFAIFAGIFGYFLPVFRLKIRGHYRRKELDRTFPDAIDLLMVCVEAGMGIDSAIRRVAQEIHITSPELAKEFKILSLELKTGKPRNECLKNLAKRTNLRDIDNLVSLLIQAQKYGTGVANALRIHAEEMRQKRYSRLEEMAAKLPVKLVIPLIFFIFPALFLVILGPAMIRVFRVIIQG